jgi:hypothetical protein
MRDREWLILMAACTIISRYWEEARGILMSPRDIAHYPLLTIWEWYLEAVTAV